MSPKKKPVQKPSAPPPFHTTPFAALKNVVVEPAPVDQPTGVIRKPTQPAQPPSRKTTEDDLFLQAMAGVQRLETTPSRSKPSATTSLNQDHPATVHRRQKTTLSRRDDVTARKTFLQEVDKLQLDVRFADSIPEEEELRPLAGNRLRQLKRGIVQLDRQLDLHGLTREEALFALSPFLQAARQAGEKAALIITGKGHHSTEGPVLQQVVAGWLRDQGRDLVSEYAPAPRELGGSGAFVIFLRPLDK